MSKLGAVMVFLTLAGSAGGQTSLDLMDVDIMFIGAHPDDDSSVMATFARYLLDEGFRGTVVTLTGGDGGGNAIGPEAGRSLALIRREEERRALALVGVEAPSFLGLTDFYFTLSAEEAARKWGSSFVCDVVRHVRLERPEVLVTMWPGPGTHGQHQMAARAATIAFTRAADPDFCAELTTKEHLRPFQPLKLYYGGRAGPTSVAIPADAFSRTASMRYADLRALGMSKYRSQGFDQFLQIPVQEARPETFLLVRSLVPVDSPEAHLLGGAILPTRTAPAGVGLRIEPESFEAPLERSVQVDVTLVNDTKDPWSELHIELSAPDGWSASPPESLAGLAPGESVVAHFDVTPSREAVVDRNQRLVASIRASVDGHTISGENFTWMRAVAPIRARFRALYDVAAYRAFARDTGTEWVIESLPARIPLVIGRRNSVEVEVASASREPSRGTLVFDTPQGVDAVGETAFTLSPGESTTVPATFDVGPEILPEGRHSTKTPLRLTATADTSVSVDNGDIYALPFLEIPHTRHAPVIDGELDDMLGFARGEISPKDVWWRREPDDASDASAVFFLAYDADYLYAGIRVRDDAVICNIAPDDIRAQLRSDAVGITVDPSGASEDTSTVMQAAAFPCTTVGFGARGFRDADARPGLMEDTAPGMEVASKRTADGYTLEARLPWSAMPQEPEPGDEIGVNIIIYDGDLKDARVGANISESGLGWAAFRWGGKQALPYLWPRVVLKP